MDNIAFILGKSVLILGGGIMAVGIIGLIGWLASVAWVFFSVTFRKICKAEILIAEYRKNRHDFMMWKEMQDGERKDNERNA